MLTVNISSKFPFRSGQRVWNLFGSGFPLNRLGHGHGQSQKRSIVTAWKCAFKCSIKVAFLMSLSLPDFCVSVVFAVLETIGQDDDFEDLERTAAKVSSLKKALLTKCPDIGK